MLISLGAFEPKLRRLHSGGEIIPYNLWRTNHRLELYARLRGMVSILS